jgi:hypothetical protein
MRGDDVHSPTTRPKNTPRMLGEKNLIGVAEARAWDCIPGQLAQHGTVKITFRLGAKR